MHKVPTQKQQRFLKKTYTELDVALKSIVAALHEGNTDLVHASAARFIATRSAFGEALNEVIRENHLRK